MQRKISTSIEQGERLLALGIDPDTTADMEWKHNRDGDEYEVCAIDGRYHKGLFADRYKYVRPAWSLGALIDLMPATICLNGYTWLEYHFRLDKDGIDYFVDSDDLYFFLKRDHNDNMIDTAVYVLEWLAEHGCLKQEKGV